MPNRLASEKSPYLLQHRDNPVDWFPWGKEAFARAAAEGKPIFLSVGYSTCHWCHVMERESFEDAKVARYMNEHFVNVKVDREERPDVDRVYMGFVQATTGSGGWPMSVFLTPDLKPFYGGTYFPPEDHHGRPGFLSLLDKIVDVWTKRRPELEASGARVISEMARAESKGSPVLLDRTVFDAGFRAFAQMFDQEHAGFGRAPKFPRPAVHDFLVRRFARTGTEEAARMVLATLHLMSRGGMYDQLGGGFHRYSVDGFWHVPHFEKMLYDQAQLVTSLVEAFQLSGDTYLARIARETCDYVLRDLTHEEGGFFSAEDADSLPPGQSEKKEGAFYVWTREQIAEVIGEAATAVVCPFWAVEPSGNAEDPHGELTGKNVLHAVTTEEALGKQLGMTTDEVTQVVTDARAKLFAARTTRPRPHRDEKVLCAWNAMMIGALARAAQVLREPKYLAAAERAARFVTTRLWDATTRTLHRRFAGGEVAIEAYLDDYANLVNSLVDLYEASFDVAWLELAEKLADRMNTLFYDEADGGFYATSGNDPSVLLRLKEDYDGAEPAGGSIAVLALLRLAETIDRSDFRRRAEATLRAFSSRLKQVPHALPKMLVALDFSWESAVQVVIAGERTDERTQLLVNSVNEHFVPGRVVLLADEATRKRLGGRLKWLAEMGPIDGVPAAYVCKDHACDRPTTDANELRQALPHRSLA